MSTTPNSRTDRGDALSGARPGEAGRGASPHLPVQAAWGQPARNEAVQGRPGGELELGFLESRLQEKTFGGTQKVY